MISRYCKELSRFLAVSILTLVAASWTIVPTRAAADSASVTALVAGDIAFCGKRKLREKVSDWLEGYTWDSGAPATAALLDRLPGAILIPGDLAYRKGSAEDFNGCYDRSWGRHKDRTYPTPGNHEYGSPGAQPYFDYWGERAGEPGKGYYSFDLGAWHIVALNSNIAADAGSDQETWLRQNLSETTAGCILAYWHHPVFSSGRHGDQGRMKDVYRTLYEAGATVVLAGHDHNYERFAPMDPDGRLDPEAGMRSFVVGTGGAQLRANRISDPPRENSEVVDGTAWGILKLTLNEEDYAWEFVPVDGQTFSDRGQAPCVKRRLAN